ncbi:Arc family DNA-binding protein [Streptomyces odontomachi]|uniref:Arc family DNA-binding protein n=1 Tax=Streptomyces odontomachi TaxID=2944940 RepID=UPI00210B682C|nr:Arc family DNA-binding protein [Streptomyces sp. ODS25]
MIKFTLRLPDDLHQRLTDQATTARRSLNSEILRLLESDLSATPSATPNRCDGDSTSPRHAGAGIRPSLEGPGTLPESKVWTIGETARARVGNQ